MRQGLVSREMIESVVGKCGVYVPKEGEQVRSPGMKYKHYAPSCKTYLFEAGEADAALKYFNSLSDIKAYVLCEDRQAEKFPAERVLNLGQTAEDMAANLYVLLRRAEEVADVLIAIKPSERGGVMDGVLNRLSKACAGEKT